MSSKIIVLFGISFGILTIPLGIMTPYNGGAAVDIIGPPATDKMRAGTEEADRMVGISGDNIIGAGTVYFIDGGGDADLLPAF